MESIAALLQIKLKVEYKMLAFCESPSLDKIMISNFYSIRMLENNQLSIALNGNYDNDVINVDIDYIGMSDNGILKALAKPIQMYSKHIKNGLKIDAYMEWVFETATVNVIHSMVLCIAINNK